MQNIAHKALREGLVAYDQRHGYHGPVAELDLDAPMVAFDAAEDSEQRDEDETEEDAAPQTWREMLDEVEEPRGLENWQLAVVLEVSTPESAMIGLKTGKIGYLPLSGVKWARKALKNDYLGPTIKTVDQVVKRGDVIIVKAISGKEADEQVFALRQIPGVNGALVAMDPHTGRVYAMAGGFSYRQSEYNRATQAKRQPGSAVKPFVYLSGLMRGLTPATMILDAPIVIDRGPGKPKWKPSNYSDKFYGPAPMRVGIEKSRNLMTIRLAQEIGMGPIVRIIQGFAINPAPPRNLSVALGSAETTLLDLTAAYGMLVNGGKKIEPHLIDMIQNRRGEAIYKEDKRACEGCSGEEASPYSKPELPDEREQIVEPQAAYQIVSMLEGVVKRGTGRRIRAVGYPLAGKTGTTNESKDTWFMGFTPDLVAGVFVGYDDPKPLGRGETGSNVAAPIFRDFMKEALRGEPKIPFRVPRGIKFVRVNAETGQLANLGDKNVILEAFQTGTEPSGEITLIRGDGEQADISAPGGGPSGGSAPNGSSSQDGLGGIY